jgi:post-segregation antitoxin (ccd killing protein)
MADYTNKIELAGKIKWEPKVFAAREEGQKDIMVFALEYHRPKSTKLSVFHVKLYGDVAEKAKTEKINIGDEVKVTGIINESKWKDKQTDQWNSRVEIWPNQLEVLSRVTDFVGVGAGDFDDDSIPF